MLYFNKFILDRLHLLSFQEKSFGKYFLITYVSVYYLFQLISDIDGGKAFQLNLHEAIQFMNESWAMVPEKVIANCFRHAGFVAPDVSAATATEVTQKEPEVKEYDNIFEKLSTLQSTTHDSVVPARLRYTSDELK